MLEQPRWKADQVDGVIPQQANRRSIETFSQEPGIPMNRFVINLGRRGHTSAVFIPLALDEARPAGRSMPGELMLMLALGAGLTYGSALIRW
jgi:3-oxoacyl-[acyl-carrier-protein] synthase-3